MAQEQNNTTKICTDYHTHTIVKLSTHTSKTLAHFTVKPPTYTKQLKPCKHTQKKPWASSTKCYLFLLFHSPPFPPLLLSLLKASRNVQGPLKSPRLTTAQPWCSGSQQTPSLHAATPWKERRKVSECWRSTSRRNSLTAILFIIQRNMLEVADSVCECLMVWHVSPSRLAANLIIARQLWCRYSQNSVSLPHLHFNWGQFDHAVRNRILWQIIFQITKTAWTFLYTPNI